MKMIFGTAAAAVALVGFAGVAQAQTVHHTSQTEYSDGFTQFVNQFLGSGAAQSLWDSNQAIGSIPGLEFVKNNSGSRYHQESAATGNTESASNNAGGTFTLTGTVDKDCSFYNGSAAGGAHTINLGTIGVRTGDADNVSIAFNQVADASANVNTATAGCNFNNRVTINKAHKGLQNNTTSSFDPNQFTNEIPYSVDATWTGVAQGSSQSGQRELQLSANTSGSQFLDSGAWRSAFNMNIAIPKQSLGLVAGTYTDTITVTLAAS
ncbi:MAG: hypothetical protein ACTHM8_14420 [Sphingomonas sp.]